MQQPLQPAQKRKKPLGPALAWSSEDITHLATISEADKKAAAALWRNEAPARFKALLEAQETDKGR
jgi:hypothetical protein